MSRESQGLLVLVTAVCPGHGSTQALEGSVLVTWPASTHPSTHRLMSRK
jgi:hypothetical protein